MDALECGAEAERTRIADRFRDRIPNLALIRERFRESRWAGWNLLRVATTTAAFISLLGHSCSTADPRDDEREAVPASASATGR